MTGPSAANHGVIGLDPGACTVCMLCARECPDWCIHIEGHPEATEAGPTGPGGRSTARSRTLVLDRFAIDWSLCMYCGICVEVCPFDALFWAPALAPPQASLLDLVHEVGDLQNHRHDVRPAASLPQRNEPRDAGVVVDNDPDGS